MVLSCVLGGGTLNRLALLLDSAQFRLCDAPRAGIQDSLEKFIGHWLRGAVCGHDVGNPTSGARHRTDLYEDPDMHVESYYSWWTWQFTNA